ncbi:MAG TPA: T9SS type A sorting domain-containing protein, partial [Bacteroidales bacterium]|nr:T9SS type A sorting domain-containing protein [Bacteroidales bacterium]
PEPSEIKVYPNPTAEQLHFDFGAFKSIPFAMELINASGQNVLRKSLNEKSGKIALGGMQNGLYILKFYFDEGVVRKKMMVE